MAHYGGNGVPDWDPNLSYENQLTPRNLNRVRITSSISAVSDMSEQAELNRTYTAVSAMSDWTSREEPPPPFSSLSSQATNNISHDYLSNGEGSDVPKKTSKSTLNKISASLPNTLRPPTNLSSKESPIRRGSGATALSSANSPDSSRRPSFPSRILSRKRSRKDSSVSPQRHNSLPDNEEISMGLLNNAMPVSFTKPVYSNSPEEDDANGGRVNMDISSFTGPMGKSQAEWEIMYQKERDGQLTGGLGAGLMPHATLTSAQILSPTSLSPARKFSLSGPVARAATVRNLAQSEANKSGKIIEVIADDDDRVNMDLSMMDDIGGIGGIGETTRSTTFKSIKHTRSFPLKPEIYYPQPNWKPFSMRWPFLTALIVISVLLAVVQEVLYQKSTKKPLYEFTDASQMPNWDYFTFKYMPTIIAVLFGIFWQFTDFEVKRLEPYYQLSREDGALAAESLNVDYITFFDFFRPLKALRLKHYAVANSSVATLLAVSLVPTMQSASLTIEPDRRIREKNPFVVKTVQLDPIFSRLLSAHLLIVAAFGCILFYQLQKRRSGLVADVKGIAGIAAMANKSHILMDFKDMDTATPAEIHNKLKKHRYTLRNSSLAPDQDNLLSKEEQEKYDDQRKIDPNPQPFMLRLTVGIPFILSMLILMILIPIFLFHDKANRVLENAPWLLTIFSVVVKLTWGTLETDVRMIEPFYILSKRHASPKVLTLDYTGMAFGYMPIRAFLNGHFTIFFLGLGSVLAEILTVLASSFGNVNGMVFITGKSQLKSGEETFVSFWVSFTLSLLILSFMIVVAIVVYMRRRHPFLPRQPSSISSVLAFIHQSRMLYDFVDTEKMNNDEMVKKLAGIGKTYGLGWFSGRDGNMHCGVDEEELASDYIHGKDGKQTNQPWNSNWGVY